MKLLMLDMPKRNNKLIPVSEKCTWHSYRKEKKLYAQLSKFFGKYLFVFHCSRLKNDLKIKKKMIQDKKMIKRLKNDLRLKKDLTIQKWFKIKNDLKIQKWFKV